jgi:predicted MFS family arabinose efflux permease
MPWRVSLWVVATAGLAVAVGIWLSLPQDRSTQRDEHTPATTRDGGRGGFELLFTIGVLDTAVRMGFLTFLPFLLQAKHAELPTIGLALALVFIGGAAGKFACGWLGARIGVLWTVLLTEGGTALAILAVIVLPLSATLVLLPLLGIMLNGTSSVLYGTVPDLAPRGRTERAFAVFYTGTIGAGAVAPVLFGFLGDVTGPEWATAATAATALATIPLALILSPRLPAQRA